MTEVVWSIHHSHKKLDRAGKVSAHGFHYIQQDSLNTLVQHNLSQNNACWCLGSVWSRVNCIPMGGPFSAQGADLHSIWKTYVHRSKFCRLGNLTVSAEGFTLWEGPYGRVSMIQFRDNIPIASDCHPDSCVDLINLIRCILKESWKLDVDCDCISPTTDHSTGGCCSGSGRQ